jgi:hypothetical protein
MKVAPTPEFVALCEKHGVKPTSRQVSKLRNGYGALARALGLSTREAPPGK